MKLAEALILRADLQKRLAQLKARISRNAKVQEGDEPAEAPGELLSEFDRLATELEALILGINQTNLSAQLDDGRSLTAALARRDVLRLRADAFRELAEAASGNQFRYSNSEVKFQSTVEVGVIQKQADTLSREFRELDAMIQQANWNTELAQN